MVVVRAKKQKVRNIQSFLLDTKYNDDKWGLCNTIAIPNGCHIDWSNGETTTVTID